LTTAWLARNNPPVTRLRSVARGRHRGGTTWLI
jgi:hypothetical protein